MMKRTLGIAALALAASAMFAESALAKNMAVGPLTCRTTITGPTVRFQTIQAAVNAALPGDVIYVCPGNYPEQVEITKALTIRGESNGTGNLAVITVPAGGLVKSIDSAAPTSDPGVPNYGAVAYQVLVKDTSFVTVLNLAVDGSVPPIAIGDCLAKPPTIGRTAGIVYFNVGTAADGGPSSGTIGNVVVRNHANNCLDFSSQGMRSVGVLLENSNVKISDSNIHTIRGDGIRQHGGIGWAERNLLMDVWDYAIKVSDATTSDVRNNTIIHAAAGVTVMSPGTDVVGNVIGPYVGTGIHLAGGDTTLVQTNRIASTTTGIWVNGTYGALITGNIVTRTGTGIIDTYSRAVGGVFPPNVIKNNEVNEAYFGLQSRESGDDTLTPNTYTNVGTLTGPY